jgi:hypothetical protein
MLGGTHRQRVAVIFGRGLLVVAVGALVWTFLASVPATAPDYALSNFVVFRIERALVVCAAFVVIGVFTARLMAGDLPSGITARGVEWKGEEGIAATLEKTEESVQKLIEANEHNDAVLQILTAGLQTLQSVPTELATLQADSSYLSSELASLNERLTAAERNNAEASEDLNKRLDVLPDDPSSKLAELEDRMAELGDRIDKLDET